jgi:hypothetical protein
MMLNFQLPDYLVIIFTLVRMQKNPTIMIAYKYRDWNNFNHRSILSKNEIYLSSPKYFNDPFDCRISENLSLINTDSKLDEFIDNISDDAGLSSSDPNYLNLRQNLRNRLETKRDELQNEIDQFSYDRLDNHTGVYCLAKHWDNILMWSHYASSHTGFCIGFDFNLLNKPGLFNQGSPVDYPVNYPQIDPLDKDFINIAIKKTTVKSIDWQYEYEYRLIKVFWPNVLSEKDRMLLLPDNCIKEVIIGLNFPDSEIKCLRANLKPDVEVYKIIKVPYSFKIDRIKI